MSAALRFAGWLLLSIAAAVVIHEIAEWLRKRSRRDVLPRTIREHEDRQRERANRDEIARAQTERMASQARERLAEMQERRRDLNTEKRRAS